MGGRAPSKDLFQGSAMSRDMNKIKKMSTIPARTNPKAKRRFKHWNTVKAQK